MTQQFFKTRRTIRMHDTDATGVIYFTQAFRFACEAFEEGLEVKGFDLKGAMENEDFVFPIVAASSQYLLPLKLAEKCKIELFLDNVGEKSVTFLSKVYIEKSNALACKVYITHACVSRKNHKSCPLIPEFVDLFK